MGKGVCIKTCKADGMAGEDETQVTLTSASGIELMSARKGRLKKPQANYC